jgi:hypothetical protein
MGHFSRSLESCVSLEAQELHIGLSFDDIRRTFVLDVLPRFFFFFCVGFCEPMVSIIKDKIEFSSEMFLFQKAGKPRNIVSKPRFPQVGKPLNIVS